jgi:hypothetical protein
MGFQNDYIKTALRLPRKLHSCIQESAGRSGRSMNAEIISRLESSFRGEQERIDQLAAEVAALRRLIEERLDK